ncbi:hypothetical protein L1987_01325 [Smallanthus sonchifolius]|uniref:Uncharacterized protein n=1 Tax=Smallanthus sonchifolius TaxID=185202 RepID=A0ACB9K4R6_9ASTR|nr:hypothetical protein L1987_01325 [Smallanthus sonchifolius]
MEEEQVHEDEVLTWDEVGISSGAGEVRRRSLQPSSSRSLVDEDSEEDMEDESEPDYPNEVEGNYSDFDDGLGMLECLMRNWEEFVGLCFDYPWVGVGYMGQGL